MKTETTEYYVDTSPFQGWKEFQTPNGEELRVEHVGLRKSATFYRKRGDAFLRVGEISLRAPAKRMTCQQLHSALLLAEDHWEHDDHVDADQ